MVKSRGREGKGMTSQGVLDGLKERRQGEKDVRCAKASKGILDGLRERRQGGKDVRCAKGEGEEEKKLGRGRSQAMGFRNVRKVRNTMEYRVW